MLGLEKKHLKRILFHDKAGFGTLTAEKGVREFDRTRFSISHIGGVTVATEGNKKKLILVKKTAFFVEKSL